MKSRNTHEEMKIGRDTHLKLNSKGQWFWFVIAALCTALLSGCMSVHVTVTGIIQSTDLPTATLPETNNTSLPIIETPTVTPIPRVTSLPVALPTLDWNAGVGQVYAGDDTWAIRNDDTIWFWGGYLASSRLTRQLSPALVLGLPELISIFPGANPVLGLTAQGDVWEWSTADPEHFVASGGFDVFVFEAALKEGLEAIVAISNGRFHRLGVDENGNVWAWGDNDHGQLGNSTMEYAETPIRVLALQDIVQVATGEAHSLALQEDGTVWEWGNQTCTREEDGSYVEYGVDQLRPVRVTGLPEIAAISAGGAISLALDRDGTVWEWGIDCTYNSPHRMLDGVTAIGTGSYHSLALRSDGTVWAWGDDNHFGQLGNGQPFETTLTPAQVLSLDDVVRISAGSYHNLALAETGELYAWGSNLFGELGNPEVQDNSSLIPVPVIWPTK